MINMYTIKKQFYTAVGLFSFFLLCGFISPLLDINSKNTFVTEVEYTLKASNPTNSLHNGVIDITVNQGKPPYKVLVYSTSMPVKEYLIDKSFSIKNLSAGQYMIVVSDSENAFKSKNITLINK